MAIKTVAVLGAGTIGASWAALFLASGRHVTLFDPAPDGEELARAAILRAAEALQALGWSKAGDLAALRFTRDPAEAVREADWIQENAPERLDVKHALYRQIEPAMAADALIASSTSGFKVSELQAGLSDASRLLIAHPFNPPHLIPLVELVANGRTAADAISRAEVFYAELGKVTVTLRKEATGHIANRLQAALWREAIHLAAEGVASVEDIDKAVAYGPGLRWAALGPTSLFHLGGGAGGIENFCAHIGGPMESWWRDLGAPTLTPEIVALLAAGMEEAKGNATDADLAHRRDALILNYLRAQRELDASDEA
ncbi:MAG: 3-hydroxyacyl-CoA dehydrogenase NAD-binding domain-containing protein [Neomegalonema sp.]|nr:3-hydroxyacyl-CoA dehydrogenase NAD-binding domain-containing protein [Neomegalonema sp.]